MRTLRYYTQIAKMQSKAMFYVHGFLCYFMPHRKYDRQRLQRLSPEDRRMVEERVAYYNRMEPCAPTGYTTRISAYKYPWNAKKKYSTYFFDLFHVLCHFPKHLGVSYEFGDVVEVPACPTFVKSRPIAGDNRNSVLLKLNAVRHFAFIDDPYSYAEKQDMVFFRNEVHQEHRRRFLDMYVGHPMVDAGMINPCPEHPEWEKPYIVKQDQLKYKFIICIEGNDVATNLKWVMASNSIAVMPRPKYETWFMEGTLIPDYHYICINDDYANMMERIEYYLAHPQEAEAIIAHAHEYVATFLDQERESLIGQEVAARYFERTGQL